MGSRGSRKHCSDSRPNGCVGWPRSNARACSGETVTCRLGPGWHRDTRSLSLRQPGKSARRRRWERCLQPARRWPPDSFRASAISVLVGAREAEPQAFGRAEGMLVEAARTLGARELRGAVYRWLETARGNSGHAEAEAMAEGLRRRRRLDISPMPSGMVRVDGDLDPEAGQVVITALRAVVDAQVKGGEGSDGSTPAQRRADGLSEVCRQWLDRIDRPAIGGERPHVSVVVDLNALTGDSGRSEHPDTGSVSPEVARRIACDASVRRVVLSPDSEPLDIGRATPVVPAAIRRAVMIRDGGCRFPGCDRPPSWSDAHHVTHWARGGATSVANLVMLCRPHHRMVHRGFTVVMRHGKPVFFRPDGARLEERGPP